MVFFVLSNSSIGPNYLCSWNSYWRWDNDPLSVYSLIIPSTFSLCCDAIDSHQYVRRWGWSFMIQGGHSHRHSISLRCLCSCVSLVSASYGPRTSISTSWVPLIFDIPVLRSQLFILMFGREDTNHHNSSYLHLPFQSVVAPNKRNTANGIQILLSHVLGDGSGPYIIGVVRLIIYRIMNSLSDLRCDSWSRWPLPGRKLVCFEYACGHC